MVGWWAKEITKREKTTTTQQTKKETKKHHVTRESHGKNICQKKTSSSQVCTYSAFFKIEFKTKAEMLIVQQR